MNSWRCTGCGLCCRGFDVTLKFNEWLNLVRTYGVGVTRAGLNKFYIQKKQDGCCLFLTMSNGTWFCGLQNMKPAACKLWPFRILDRPKYGRAKEALFNYKDRRFFIYVDSVCPQIGWGRPATKMVHDVIPEFIDIALGQREKQFYSTSTMLYNLYPRRKWDHRLV